MPTAGEKLADDLQSEVTDLDDAMRVIETALVKKDAEIFRLCALIKSAPHEPDCNLNVRRAWINRHDTFCDCWKSKVREE